MLYNEHPSHRKEAFALLATNLERVALISVHGGPLVPAGAEGAGGQNVYVRELARGLSRLGLQVDVFTRGLHHTAPEVRTLERARVIRLPAGPPGFLRRDELFRHLGEFLQGMDDFVQGEGRGYQLIHSNYWLSGWVGMQCARRWAVPQVHTHHSLGAVKFTAAGCLPQLGRARLRIEDELLSRCASLVATSPADLEAMRGYYRLQCPVRIIPCGVDGHLFKPRSRAAARAALGLSHDGPVLAYVGRFDAQKGVETLIEAAARLSPRHRLRVMLAGGYATRGDDAGEFQRIQRLAEQTGLECHFLGKVDHQNLPDVYAASDLCVVPSHYESFGMVALEAQACGRPVVASDVGGLRHTVVDGQTGLLVPPRDACAFAGAIARLLEQPRLAERLGQTAALRVERGFTWPVVAGEMAQLYRQLCPLPLVGKCG